MPGNLFYRHLHGKSLAFAVFCGCLLATPLIGQMANGSKPPPPPPLPPAGLPVPPPPPANLPDPAELIQQLRQLEELLQMSPEQLDRLAQSIEYIRNMQAADREAMRIRLRQVTQMTPQIQAEIRALQQLLPTAERSNLSQFWLAASVAERERYRAAMADLATEDQAAWLLPKVREFATARDQAFEAMRSNLQRKSPQDPNK